MPRTTTTFLDNYLLKDFGRTETLVKILLRNGQYRYFATDIMTVAGNNYTDDLIYAGDIEDSTDSTVDKVELVIGNVGKALGLEFNEYIFADAWFYRYSEDEKGENETNELFFGKLVPLKVTQEEARFELIDALVAAGTCITTWTLGSDCHNIFKDANCGHTGSQTVCNKKLKGDCFVTHRFVGEVFPIIQVQYTPPTDVPVVGGGSGGGNGGGWDNIGRDPYQGELYY